MTQTPSIASSYTFDPFARHQFYHDVNESLARRAIQAVNRSLPQGQAARVVELASGTGAVTELILDELEREGRPGSVIGVEPSSEAIDIARERLNDRAVEFIQGEADQVAELGPHADAAFFCNAIHLIPDKADVIHKLAAALRPGGYLAINSSFYTGAYAPGSERFYHLWTRRALGWLRANHPGVRTSRQEKAMAMQWLSADGYAEVLADCGLRVVERAEEVAQMPLSSWQDIGRYWLFIEGALPGVPIPIAAEALYNAAGQAFEELGLTAVPRVWLQLVAQKVE
ncbi:MAG: class I SAM-dependent methyltransferase [Chloroflexota bacterium]|nr:class I SAM-dependent methyltransferase [Chloroflexota bacterium]